MSLDPGVTYRLLGGEDELRAAGILLGHARAAAGPMDLGAEDIVLGAFEGPRMVGATASRMMPDDASPARVESARLHVSSLAVQADASGKGIAAGLMRLQRLLAVQQGMPLVTWHQDPLEGRLAHLAVHKLGAVSRGMLGDARNGERLLELEWWVSSPRVQSRLTGGRPDLDLAHALDAGAPKLNTGRLDDDGLLRPTGGHIPPDGATALVEVPNALEDLRARDPGLLAEWRGHLDSILLNAFSLGYWLTDYLWLRGERVPRAYYLLIDGERTLG